MDKKIMLMDMIKELNKVWEAFYLLEAYAEAEIARIKREVAEEIINLLDKASVYSKGENTIFTSSVMEVCDDFRKDIVEVLKKKYGVK